MTIPSPSKSLLIAFHTWKVNSEYDMTYDYNLRARATSLNIVAGIMKKNLSFITKIAFSNVKDFSDSVKKLSAKKPKGSSI